MRNFLVGVVITLLIITSTASIMVVNKLNDIQSSIENLKVATENDLNKKVHIKSDKLDKVLNDFMINAFNAANQELINKSKWEVNDD